MNKVVVIGAGASGLVAAINAARCGANVTLIEKNNKVGKKLLATGNGRCNLTNIDMSLDKYRGENSSFVEKIINKYDTKEIIKFFDSISLKTKDINGYVYPFSMQASTVVDKLLSMCISLGVNILLETECKDILVNKDESISVILDSDKIVANKVIVATGLVAGIGVKGDNINTNEVFALKCAKKMGHNVYSITPGLTGVKVDNSYLSKVSGVRWESKVSTYIDNKLIYEDRGELQFADYGISGIVVFQNARFVSKNIKNNKKIEMFVDLMPDFCQKELKILLEDMFDKFENMSVFDVLTGIFNNKLVTYILLNLNINGSMKARAFDDINKLVDFIKMHKLIVKGTRGFEFAQVCAGGIDTSEICDDFESKLVKNIYYIGEALDVDGMCGGYNLHFAFASGIEAGYSAGKVTK